MRRRGFLWLSLTLVALAAFGFGLYAQDSESSNEETTAEEATIDETEETTIDEAQEATTDEAEEATIDTKDEATDEAPPTSASDTIDWEEALFVLMVVALVMLGLIGFEWIHRRKQSFR